MPWLERDVAICGSQAAVSAGVCDTGEDMAKAPRLNSSLNPPSQCAVAYGALRLGCDGNVQSRDKSKVF